MPASELRRFLFHVLAVPFVVITLLFAHAVGFAVGYTRNSPDHALLQNKVEQLNLLINEEEIIFNALRAELEAHREWGIEI